MRKVIKIKITHKNTPENYSPQFGKMLFQQCLCFKGSMPEPPKFPPAHNKCPSSSTLTLNPPRSVFFLQILLLIRGKNSKVYFIATSMCQALCSRLVFFPLVLTTSLQGKDYYSTHLTDEDTYVSSLQIQAQTA